MSEPLPTWVNLKLTTAPNKSILILWRLYNEGTYDPLSTAIPYLRQGDLSIPLDEFKTLGRWQILDKIIPALPMRHFRFLDTLNIDMLHATGNTPKELDPEGLGSIYSGGNAPRIKLELTSDTTRHVKGHRFRAALDQGLLIEELIGRLRRLHGLRESEPLSHDPAEVGMMEGANRELYRIIEWVNGAIEGNGRASP